MRRENRELLHARPLLALSADGRMLVGGSLEQGAFLCDPVHGVRDLEDFVQEVGLALGHWRLHEATGISADGAPPFGTGQFLTSTQGWILRLRDTLDNDGEGLVDLDDPSCVDPDGSFEMVRRDLVVDVRPGRDANVIRPGSPQLVRVAALGSATADVLAIEDRQMPLPQSPSSSKTSTPTTTWISWPDSAPETRASRSETRRAACGARSGARPSRPAMPCLRSAGSA